MKYVIINQRLAGGGLDPSQNQKDIQNRTITIPLPPPKQSISLSSIPFRPTRRPRPLLRDPTTAIRFSPAVMAPSAPLNVSSGALDFVLHIAYTACSNVVWHTPRLRPGQAAALRHVGDPSKPRNLLLVQRTGSGKTHTNRVAGVAEKRESPS